MASPRHAAPPPEHTKSVAGRLRLLCLLHLIYGTWYGTAKPLNGST